MVYSKLLLNVLTIVEAGFELAELVQDIKAREDAGMSQREVADYLRKLRDESLGKLDSIK